MVYIIEEDGEEIYVTNLDLSTRANFQKQSRTKGYTVVYNIEHKGDYDAFKIEVSSEEDKNIFVSLIRNYSLTDHVPFNFNGRVDSSEVFRQSPHDVNAWIVESIAMQAMPVAAIQSSEGFEVAVSDSPFKYKNFTTQAFYPQEGQVRISSGDNAQTPGIQPDTSEVLDLDYNAEKTQIFTPGKVLPYFHEVSASKSHSFQGMIFKSDDKNLRELRKSITINAS